MTFSVSTTEIRDLVVISPKFIGDERGFFMEAYNQDTFREAGLPTNFVQWNHSRSARGVIRGLHFQWHPPMGKLMRVTRGAAYLVAVDIRVGSPTLGKWFGTEASEANRKLVFAPAGFARGFCALTDETEVQYLCTGTYSASGESGILWNDPEIGVAWPEVGSVNLSAKDQTARTLRDWLNGPDAQHFQY
jgi:dTDP-4-dehydrorhamnose 3,5-epimerase